MTTIIGVDIGKENSVDLLDRQIIPVDKKVVSEQVDTLKAYGVVPMFSSVSGTVEGKVFQYDDGGCYDCHSCDECDPSPL